MTVKIDSFGVTNLGKVRENNEDNFLIVDIKKSVTIVHSSLSEESLASRFGAGSAHLYAVADGVGGGPSGEEASEGALNALLRYASDTVGCFNSYTPTREIELIDKLEATVQGVHDKLRTDQMNKWGEVPATTLTMLLLIWPRAYLIHVGDSRAYVKRGDRVQQLTRDQTFGNYMVNMGAWTEEQAATSKPGAILSSAVGGSEMMPVVGLIDLDPGDSLLLCTDGLTRYADDDLIASVLKQSSNAEETCGQLVAHALEGGGKDNITVIVVRTSESR
jgi:protein phosphatase